jgi:hypothetical protein
VILVAEIDRRAAKNGFISLDGFNALHQRLSEPADH